MSWLERVDQERLRQSQQIEQDRIKRETEACQRQESAGTEPPNRFKSHLESLGVLEQLERVNQEVWAGKGKVAVDTTPTSATAAIRAQAHQIAMLTEGVYRQTFGRHPDPSKKHYSPISGEPSQVFYGDRWGFYQKHIGRKVVGYSDDRNIDHSLEVSVSSNEMITIGVESHTGRGWENLKIKDSHSLDKRTINSFTQNLERTRQRSFSDPRYYHNNGVGHNNNGSIYFLVLDYWGFSSFDPDLARRVIEAGLLASCVARTPNPLERDLATEQSEITRITSLIGTVLL